MKKNNVIVKKDKNKVSLYKKLSPNIRGDVRYKISPSKLRLKFLYLWFKILKKKKEPSKNVR